MYSKEVKENLLVKETQCNINNRYMTEVQKDINEKMRAVLVDWLCEVCDQFGYLIETFFLTVNLVDRYLNSCNVERRNLQLVGVAACCIAVKYEEMHPPSLEDFLYISANTYTKAQLLNMERRILETLAFRCSLPTTISFLNELLIGEPADRISMCHFLAQTASLSVDPQSLHSVHPLPLPLAPLLPYRHSPP